MPMWRCPHCGTPQHEAARCWVCRRSSTICSTCRHFRQSLVTSVGYCGLDPRRAPLAGTELRGCWTARPDAVVAGGAVHDAVMPGPESPLAVAADVRPIPVAVARLRSTQRPGILEGFVPLELADGGPRILRPAESGERARATDRRTSPGRPGAIDQPHAGSAAPQTGGSQPTIDAEAWAERDSLFGDL